MKIKIKFHTKLFIVIGLTVCLSMVCMLVILQETIKKHIHDNIKARFESTRVALRHLQSLRKKYVVDSIHNLASSNIQFRTILSMASVSAYDLGFGNHVNEVEVLKDANLRLNSLVPFLSVYDECDIFVVVNAKGTLLFSKAGPKRFGDDLTNLRLFEELAEKDVAADVWYTDTQKEIDFLFPDKGGKAAFQVIAKPVVFKGEIHGIVIYGNCIDKNTLSRIKRISGVDMALYSTKGIYASTLTSVATQALIPFIRYEDFKEDTAVYEFILNRENFLAMRFPVLPKLQLDEGGFFVLKSLTQELKFLSLIRMTILIVGGAILSIAIGFSYFLSRGITRPVQKLAMAARIIGTGQLDTKVNISTGDELEQLGNAFNIMAAKVKESVEGLENKVRERTIELEKAGIKTDAIIQNMSDGLVALDPNLKIFLTNKKFEELTGKSEVVGRDITSISEVFGRVAKDTLKEKNTSITDITINKNLILKISSSLITHDNTVLGVIFLLRDITVEKEVDSMKTNFISTVSHELRTPLTSVLGFASNARSFYQKDIMPMIPKDNKKLNRRSKTIYENLCIIISEGERLTRLIDDVLDIAKMEAGKIEWNIQNVNIIDVCRQSLAAVSGYPKSSNVDVVFDPPDTVVDVVGDPDRLVQVIANLMSNALKFTEEGSVTLKVEPMKNNVRVSVIDSGKGINENDLNDVFEKFKQVGDDILTDKPKGTGLGLPICKEIIEHIGGKIWAESELGVGSRFCFTLDYAQKVITQEELFAPVYNYRVIDEVTKKVVYKKKSTTPQILIVDDDINTRKLLRQELEMLKCKVLEAKNGLEAITITKNKCDCLDLIILDIMMPEIDGFEVLGAIKTNEKLSHIPIIVLSAYEVENKVYRLGAEDFISKPIDKDKFISAVTKHLSESGEKKVLIIDNDKNIIKVITKALVGRGCVVRGAGNSEDGLKMAQSERPDIIMFGMESQDIENGLETIKKLRLDKKTRHIYIILIVDSMDKDLQKTAELLKVDIINAKREDLKIS